MFCRKFTFSLPLLGLCANLIGQTPTDTLRWTLQQADSRFLEKNLLLLANRSNIDLAQALTQQAKLWDNPVLNTNNNLYNAHDGRAFDSQQIYVQVQQLLRLGGKRRRLVAVQQDNERLSADQFNALLRELHYQIHEDFINLAIGRQKAALYSGELAQLDQLLQSMRPQADSGYVAQQELLRIEALAYNLRQDYLALVRDQAAGQSELNILLQLPPDTLVEPQDPGVPAGVALQLSDLLEKAARSRPELHLAADQTALAEKNTAYQKALAVPDLNLGLEYDRSSGFAPNLFNVQFSLPLPAFNRNQGNIRAAQIQARQSALLLEQTRQQVEQEVVGGYIQFQAMAREIVDNTPASRFLQSYAAMMGNLLQLFRERRLGLLEFVDQFDAYQQSQIKRLDSLQAYWQAGENLNYVVGEKVF